MHESAPTMTTITADRSIVLCSKDGKISITVLLILVRQLGEILIVGNNNYQNHFCSTWAENNKKWKGIYYEMECQKCNGGKSKIPNPKSSDFKFILPTHACQLFIEDLEGSEGVLFHFGILVTSTFTTFWILLRTVRQSFFYSWSIIWVFSSTSTNQNDLSS